MPADRSVLLDPQIEICCARSHRPRNPDCACCAIALACDREDDGPLFGDLPSIVVRRRETSDMEEHQHGPYNLNLWSRTMTNESLDRTRKAAANRTPNENPLGSHPVGTGVGAAAGGLAGGVAAGAVAGAVTGTTVGPVGTAIGAVVGAVVGGLAGKGVAEMIDPAAEDAYWRDNYSSRPYVRAAAPTTTTARLSLRRR